MDERDDLTTGGLEERLDALGRVPVEPGVAAAHLSAMAAIEVAPARFRFGWRAVAGAAVIGFLAGSTGLAAAGTLPDPAQDVAHDVLGAVGIDVPRSTEGCPDGQAFRNHGEYVSSVEAAGGDVEAASHSDCGMPVRGGGRGGGQGHGRGQGGAPAPGVPREDTDGDPCAGPPPWAGAHLPADQRAALQEEHRNSCGEDEAESEDEAEDEAEAEDAPAVEPAPEPESEPTTTAVPEPTTTLPESTTTTAG